MTRRRLGTAVLLLGLLVGGGWWASRFQPLQPATHTVVAGDTLSKIARAHGVTVADLRARNGIEGDLIEVDQILILPRDSVVSEPNSEGASSHRSAGSSRARRAEPAPAPAGGGLPTLSPPSPKPCLEGPAADGLDADGDEAAFAASKGLSAGQISEAMNRFLPRLSRCLPAGEVTQGVLLLDLTVACSGVVDSVTVVDDDLLAATLVACVTRDLRAAPFPAHDMPDGMEFRYPMRFY